MMSLEKSDPLAWALFSMDVAVSMAPPSWMIEP
jgi:hypothetical protein